MRGILDVFTKRNLPSPSHRERATKRIAYSPELNICAVSDVGRVRDRNEDAFYISPDNNWFAVADGMGGHEAGEIAAALAIQTVVEHLTPERVAAAAADNSISGLLQDAIVSAHKQVRDANKKRRSGKEMGCTLALGCIVNGLISCHVGDVRCYIVRDGRLRQLTKDHSTVGALVEAGQLTPEEARVHPKKNEVLQAVGILTGVSPDVNHAGLVSGDRVLLCSDGLWEALSHEEIQSILASDGTVRQLAVQLVDRANDAGGQDNITVILCEVARSTQTETQDAVAAKER